MIFPHLLFITRAYNEETVLQYVIDAMLLLLLLLRVTSGNLTRLARGLVDGA